MDRREGEYPHADKKARSKLDRASKKAEPIISDRPLETKPFRVQEDFQRRPKS